MAHDPLKLIVFDATQVWQRPLGLGASWYVGSWLYRALARVDAGFGAHSWTEALSFIEHYQPGRAISEVQYWGHGKWGCALIGGEAFDLAALRPHHSLARGLQALRARLAPDALLWFRTCETLGASRGHEFSARLADFSGARVAGHTFEIGFLQSGLQVLCPGMAPHWSPAEGLARGTAEAPVRALPSSPSAPNTITCLTGVIPPSFAPASLPGSRL
jgi:hypothetical protein